MMALITFLFAFLLSYLGTLGLLKVRLRGGFVDIPNERSSHEEPKPRFGGIAMVGAFCAALLVLLFAVPATRSFIPFVIGGLLLFAGGVFDDWRGLPVPVRFAIQVVSALIIVLSGGVVDFINLPMAGGIDLGAVSIPFTVLFILACINFYNFIDGIDGLAAGTAFISSCFLSLIAYILGHFPLALLSLAVGGSTLGFLQFNFPPSRLFMGDGGSTFLGFFFAYIAIAGNRMVPELPFFIPVLILSSLYLDAGLTLIKRGFKGERIFDAHHTHYYQRLLSLGLNHKQVTLLEYVLTVLLGMSAVIYFKAGGLFPVFLTGCWIVIFTALILKIRSLERGDRLFWEKRTLLVVAVDLLLITVSYMGAYFLRLNFRFTHPEGIAMLKAFPIVLVVRSACFHKFGLYRGVWKYTSTEDLLKIIKAVTTGSVIILTCVVLLYRFVAFPRSLFIIEYFLLIFFIGGARLGFRIFHEFGKEVHGTGVRRAALIGAGDVGDQMAREIKNMEGSKTNVVCFIDDDKEKIGLTLRGLPIHGPIDKIKEICLEQRIESLFLATSALPTGKMREILRVSQAIGVPIEGRGGTLQKREEPAVVLFDRLGKGLGRGITRGLDDLEGKYRAFFKNRNVLVTGGGAPVVPALVRELLNFGASVTVQISFPVEAEKYDNMPDESLSIFLGGLDQQLDVSRLLEVTIPDIVFNCARLEIPEAINAEAYLWHRVVRGTDVLVRKLERYPVFSFNTLVFWEGTQAGAPASFAGAAVEAVVLNAEEIMQAASTVIRFPRVLDEKSLRLIMDDQPMPLGKDSFELFETEVISAAFDVAVFHRKRALFVPSSISSFSKKAVQKTLSGPAAATISELCPTAPGQARLGLVFPVEAVKFCTFQGLMEITGPLFPADAMIKRAVSSLSMASKSGVRSEVLADFSARLLETVPGRLHAPVD